MEYRDVYTRDGKPLNRVKEKHEKPEPGEYFRHALVIMKTEDSPAPGQGEGLYIMQQRSLKARFFPGMWDATGGGVRHGETAAQAAVREVREELGIELDEARLTRSWDFVSEWGNDTGLLVTVFACRAKAPAGGFPFDPTEVNDVKVVPYGLFAEKMREHNDDDFARELESVERTI